MDAPSPAPTARRALLGAALLGLLADALLRHGPWGLGLLPWMVLFAATLIVIVRRDGRSLSREGAAWLGVALLLAAAQAWRDADVLHAFNLLAMLGALGLLAMSLNALPVPSLALARVRDLLRAAFGTGLAVATGAVPLALRDAELHAIAGPSGTARGWRVARAVLITAPVLLVFTLLLVQADPLFGSLLTIPRFDVDEALSHVVIAGFFAWVVAGWMRRALLARPSSDDGDGLTLPLTLGTTDIASSLGALTALFAAFVLVQVGWLFGGESLVVRTTGLGYAEYARRGFLELTVVAALLLPVLLGSKALIPSTDARAHRLHRRLAVLLVLLLGAIMLSAAARMQLYIRFYGISTARLYATAFMTWLALVFLWLTFTVLRSRPRSFAAGLVGSGYFVLFALNLLNPDLLVARAQVARARVARATAAQPDLRYVASLGGDGVSALVAELAAPGAIAPDSARQADRCRAAGRLLRRWTGSAAERRREHWTQWNAGRARASRAVEANEGALRAQACSQVLGAGIGPAPRDPLSVRPGPMGTPGPGGQPAPR